MRKSGTRWHFLVRDMVESFEITVPFVRTDENVADFFTKPLPAKKFLEMRRILMNEDADPTLTSGDRPRSPASVLDATVVRGGASQSGASKALSAVSVRAAPTGLERPGVCARCDACRYVCSRV